jgi:tetratricopeptide (TPR) repeat protein/transcriptional regulator with XRE-family HTH domain
MMPGAVMDCHPSNPSLHPSTKPSDTMPNPQRLDILRQLREEAGLTQRDMARVCGLRGRQSHQTAGSWERGTVTPTATRRSRFIGYLWDYLRLNKNPEQFEEVWEVLVAEWNWDPISDKEWASFTHQQRVHGQRSGDDLQSAGQLEERNRRASGTSQADTPLLVSSALIDPDALALDEPPEPGPLPPGSRMPLGRNPLFVGRKKDLLALASALTTQQAAAVTQVETAAATGLGGIGKTQLASEFVHRYGRYFTGGVFWLNFDEATTVSAEVAGCGGPGGMELRADFVTRPLHEQVQLVKAAWQESVARLLVFDNCEEPELLVRWRPTSGGCRVLVTSRRLDWDLSIGVQVYALDVLDRQDSLELLTRYNGQADLEILHAIAEELGDLPLALHLAASYLHRYRRVVTPKQYLAQLRHPPLLAHPSLLGTGISPTGHIQHVGRTFALSYDRLDRAEPVDAQAHQLLLILALLAPGEPAPYSFLAETVGIDLTELQQAVAFEDAVARLSALGLVDVHENRQVRIHRLLAAFVRESAAEHVPHAQAQVEVIVQRKLEESNPDKNFHVQSPLRLLPIQAHLRHVVELALQHQDGHGAGLCHAFAKHLWDLGDYAEARAYVERELKINLQRYGAFYKETAASHHLLGNLLQENGEFGQAQVHLQSALDIRLQLVGELDFDVADTLANLGELHWLEQRIPEAIHCLERALAICEEVAEEDHPLIAEIAMTLALCLLDGHYDPQQARHLMREALRIRRARLGEDHPYTALAYTNMGYLLVQIGEPEEAGAYYEQGLLIRQRTLGEEHTDTATSLYSLGRLRRMQARWEEAQAYLEQAMAIFLARHGNKYVFVASCLNELGMVWLGRNNSTQACRYIEQALAIRRKLYHADHPHVANTLQNLGVVLLAKGEADAAQQTLLQALQVRRQVRDPENQQVAETLYSLGQVAEVRCEFKQAQEYYSEAFAIYMRTVGAKDPRTQQVAAKLM